MYPPIFRVCSRNYAVEALLLNDGILRIFPHGRAPQGVEYPYVTWQVVGGSPENYISNKPDMDGYTIQVNCYGKTGNEANATAAAIRDAIEWDAHVVSWRGDDTDPETQKPYTSFDIDWLINR